MVSYHNSRGVFKHRAKNTRSAKFELGDAKDLFATP